MVGSSLINELIKICIRKNCYRITLFCKESVVNFQLWSSNDVEHRLHPQKTIDIIRLSQQRLQLKDEQIEVEYQGETIGKFALGFDGNYFHLLSKQTDCLAKDACAVPERETAANESCCDPASGCC